MAGTQARQRVRQFLPPRAWRILEPHIFRISSWPGLSRPSTIVFLLHAENVDARHKAGHDKFRDLAVATLLSRRWGDVRAPLMGVIVMAGIVVRGVA